MNLKHMFYRRYWVLLMAILTVLSAGLTSPPLCAAPPPNDAFAGRLPLTTGVAARSTTVGATVEASEPKPFGIAPEKLQASVWWSWTAASTLVSSFLVP